MNYTTERKMSKDFESFLKTNVGATFFKEVQGLFGIPDYVYFEKNKDEVNIVSFELKLTNWKQAMIQAFRYRGFSDQVYVVMPEDAIERAIVHSDQFETYGIGLASFSPNCFSIVISAQKHTPYSQTLREKMMERVKRSRKKSACTSYFAV